ncbi:MAG: phosphoadenosine phosphosulfate reductase family protein [Desulfobacterales bacterium]|nr:phosphoadenosine phosphosulfate reductase family protein [Desulfobacterales bacterium]
MKSRLNYSTWKTSNQSILKDLSGKKVMIAYSGGKDSSVGLYLIQKAAEEFGFSYEAHGVFFPTHVYSAKDVKRIESYWHKRNVNIHWHKVPVSETCLEQALKDGQSPCLTCTQTKKKFLISYLNQMVSDWNSIVIIMSYSLWDLVSATLENISGAIFSDKSHPKSLQGKSSEERFIETAQRFYPLLKLKQGPTIYKPLIKYNDQDIHKFILENKIPLTTTSCKFKEFRPKRTFATYYEKTDLFFDYSKVFDFSKKSLNLPDISYYEKIESSEYMNRII